MLADTLHRLFERLAGRSQPAPNAHEVEALLDGDHAVAAVEGCVSDAAAYSRSLLGHGAGELLAAAAPRRADDQPALQVHPCADGRAALATASGLALSGTRTSVFLGGGELLGAIDHLQRAVALHLPLVVHVSCRAPATHGATLGSGHEGYHAAEDSGCVLLFARDAQHALDLSLIARRAAEQALIPVVVALDGETTARAISPVRIPPLSLVSALLGSATDATRPVTPAQQTIHGKTRRRVPRRFDLDRPALLCAAHCGQSWSLLASGQRPYRGQHVPQILNDARARYAELTGRQLDTLDDHRAADATTLLVAQGAAVDAACAVVDRLRAERRGALGVLGLTQLQPLDRDRLVAALQRARSIIVLERSDSPLRRDPPLSRTVASLLQSAANPTDSGSRPRRQRGGSPRLTTAIYGRGGFPLRAADLAHLGSEPPATAGPLYLGHDFGSQPSQLPKRAAAADALRRLYPDVPSQGLLATEPLDARPVDSVTIACFPGPDGDPDVIIPELAQLLRDAAGGTVRGWIPTTTNRPGCGPAARVSWLADAGRPMPYVGDDEPCDVAVVPRLARHLLPAAVFALRSGGVLLTEQGNGEAPGGVSLSPKLQRELAQRKLSLCGYSAASDRASRRESLLGAISSVIIQRQLIPVTARQITDARRRALQTNGATAADSSVEALEESLRAVERLDPARLAEQAPHDGMALPSLVRRMGDAERQVATPSDNLPHFWNTVGYSLRAESNEQPMIDPLASAGSIPPLSAGLRRGTQATTIPALRAEACTGCGVCWSICPDGAIAPLALTPRELIDGGLDLAQQHGTDCGALRPLLGKWATRVAARLREVESLPEDGRALLEPALGDVLAHAKLDGERAERAANAGKAICTTLAPLATSRTPGRREVLAIAIDPDSCKGCGLCVASCEPRALSTETRDSATVGLQRDRIALWEELPDTSGDTIARLAETDVGPLASVLLSRHCLHALAPRDDVEAGSGAKIALRGALALAEYEQQRIVTAQIDALRKLRDGVASRTREQLAGALPTGDLDALAAGIDALGRSHVSLGELTGRIEEVVQRGDVDAARLKRLVDIARDLSDLDWRLSRGVHGLGRSRCALLVSDDRLCYGLGSYPYNPFQTPTLFAHEDDPAPLALGLLQGQLRQSLESARSARLARLELDEPKLAELRRPELARLGFGELDEEERRRCAPLLLVTSSLPAAALAALTRGHLPLKIVLLDDGATAELDPRATDKLDALGLIALGYQRCYVAQSSIAAPRHLFEALSGAMRHPGPSLLSIHAPSPAQHGFATDATLAQAALAFRSRCWPLFVLAPPNGRRLVDRLSLEHNPDVTEPWTQGEAAGVPLGPLDWLLSESRFSQHFSPLDASSPTPLRACDYLLLDPNEQRSRTPFAQTKDGERLRPSGPALAFSCERTRTWQALQQLAGVTSQVSVAAAEQAEEALQTEHARALRALEQHYEARLAEQQREQTATAARQVRDRLLALAGYPAPVEQKR
jgi:pyruvate-ferredoxin/flavodoxin oxidoreductase